MVNMCTLGLRKCAVGWWILSGLVLAESAHGQMAGSRAQDERQGAAAETPLLAPEVATRYITVTGTAERSVLPTEMRLIWAITAEDPEPQRCRQILREHVAKVAATWRNVGIAESDIAEDFIAALPRYEWTDETRGETHFLVEKRTGYRVQTNLHVRARDEQQALQVVDAALAAGVTDLVGVDYVADLTVVQRETRQAALVAAQDKSAVLLKAVFAEMPQPINVAERSEVYFPAEQYASFENVAADVFDNGYANERRRIYAYRPKNTYYRGSTAAADDRQYELPMRPKIVVQATVQIYYLSPAAATIHPAGGNSADPR